MIVTTLCSTLRIRAQALSTGTRYRSNCLSVLAGDGPSTNQALEASGPHRPVTCRPMISRGPWSQEPQSTYKGHGMPWPCGQQHRTVGSLTTPLSCSPFAFSGEPKEAACPAPLAIPPGTRLRGPSGSLRCSGWQGPAELGSASLKHAAVLFPANPALLARVNGDWVRACFTSD